MIICRDSVMCEKEREYPEEGPEKGLEEEDLAE